MRKDIRKLSVAVVLTMSALARPEPARAADAPDTCAQTYLLCVNDASQVDGWFERTLSEMACGYNYFRCLRNQATGV